MNSKPRRRPGQWVPSDRKIIDKWLADISVKVNEKYKDKVDLLLALHPPNEDAAEMKDFHGLKNIEAQEYGFHPPVQALMDAIFTDPEINMLFHQMFWQQQPDTHPAKKIWCWQMMIAYIDYIMTIAPEYTKGGLVGFPINVILNWPMATTAGFAAFLNDKVNKLFKDILNYWQDTFLSQPASTYVLSDDPRNGWFGEDAMQEMPHFAHDFKCDPSLPHYGFKSWDDFFVREYRPGIRPVAAPNDNSIVANACESAPYKLARNVKKRDLFWIKNQQYSMKFMMNNKLVEKFYGGTVYQAFLSALSYHRWHSPVSGTVVEAYVVDGSYCSQTYDIQDDPASPNKSQGYLCQVASRAIIFINADNPNIGLMCFIAIGMSEVSSNVITAKAEDYIKKGQEIGMFHFDGSTHCLVFRPDVNIDFDLRGQVPGLDTKNMPVRSQIAMVGSKNT